MRVTVRIEGLNLERLLRLAADEGMALRDVRRVGDGAMVVRVGAREARRLRALCARAGWAIQERHADAPVRAARLAVRRASLALGLCLCVALVGLSSGMILAVRVDNAQAYVAEVRRFLAEEGVRPGARKAAFSLDELRERLALRLPGLAYTGMRYAGSTLVVDCQPSLTGESTATAGEGMDIVASEAGVITRIAVSSGTPQVEPGQAVRRGQVLISGQERTQKGGTRGVRAEGQVLARVWARGEADARLNGALTVETGRVRRRVTLRTPWHSRVVRDARPFATQDASVERQAVVGLFLPVWREIETYAETIVTPAPLEPAQAYAAAQGAAEEIARKQCPYDAAILDKWVDCQTDGDQYVRATVILEYERSIAARGNP